MQQNTHKTNTQLLDELKELRHRNSELEGTKSFYETIMESILNGVWVSDKDDVLFYANKGMEIISGLSRRQFTNGNLFENFQEQTLQYFSPLYLKAKETLEPIYYDSVPVITPVGRQSYQSGWLIPRIKNEAYDGMVCTVEDVTSRKTAEEELKKSHDLLEERVAERTDELLKANQQIQKEVEDRKQVEESLRESEERFRAIADYSYDWETWVDPDGKLIWVNPAIEKITGYSVEEYLHLPDRLKQIFLDEDRNRALSHIENGLRHRQSGNDVEFQIRCKDGSLKWVSISYQPIYTKKGECLGLRSSVRDISERKLAEQVVKESEERFKAVAESSPAAIITTDSSGKIIFWNKSAEVIYGYTAQEIVGKSIELLRPEDKRLVDRKNRENFIKTGHSPYIGKTVEGLARKKDGTEFLSETSTSSWKMGGEIMFCGIVRDITERKREEDALRASEERFRVIFENAGIGITLVDRKGCFLKVNPALEKIYGYSASELAAMRFTELTHPDDVKGNFDIFTELMEGKREYYQLEKRYIGKHNRAIWSRLTVSLLRDSTGSPQCALSMVEDITERKQQEMALQEREERFRAISESTPDAIFITDGSGKVLYCNKAVEKIYRYSEGELIGKSIEVVEPERFRPFSRKNRERLFKEGSSHYTGKTVEGIAVRKGGVEFPAEISISYWKIGDQPYFSRIVRDITQRKQQEEALRESEERFRAIAESSSDAIITTDSSGKILFWNKAAETVYGYSAEEIVGKPVELIRPKGKRLIDIKNRENFIKTGHSPYVGKAAEGLALKKDGTEFLTETSISSWEIADQVYFSGIVRDITERKRMEQELQTAHDELEKKVKQRTVELSKTNKELQAAKDYLKKYSGKLLAIREEERRNISTTLHDELGSMSVSVGSKISIAKEELKENNAKAALKYLKQGETVLRQAVGDIRKLAVDLRPPSLENMGLSAALRDYIETIKKHSKIKITFRNDLGNKKILGAAAIAIYRVAQEAITNISKHSKAKKVRVRLYADNKSIKLNVADDGVGFDVEKIYRYSKRGRFKMGIVGMKERIESLGGELVIKSTLRKGTLIKASLPKE